MTAKYQEHLKFIRNMDEITAGMRILVVPFPDPWNNGPYIFKVSQIEEPQRRYMTCESAFAGYGEGGRINFLDWEKHPFKYGMYPTLIYEIPEDATIIMVFARFIGDCGRESKIDFYFQERLSNGNLVYRNLFGWGLCESLSKHYENIKGLEDVLIDEEDVSSSSSYDNDISTTLYYSKPKF